MIRVLIGAGVAVGVLAMVFIFGRQPIAQFLYERKVAEGQMALRAYLDGRTPLDSAATRYNKALDEAVPYLELLASDPSISWAESKTSVSTSWARIEEVPINADRVLEEDPRVAVFYDRAQYLRLGARRYKELQDWMQARRDSLSRVRSDSVH